MNSNTSAFMLLAGGIFILPSCNPEIERNVDKNNLTAKPNIILLVSDDHGRGDLGCYGNKFILTPCLDGLAAEGIRMSNAYCTSASCSASRSVILTGLYNHANGQYGHSHHYHHFSSFPGIRSLPVLLSEGGYQTARAGKFHIEPEEVFKFDKSIEHAGRNAVRLAKACAEFIRTSQEPFFLYFCTDDPHRSGEYNTSINGSPNRFGNSDQAFDEVETIIFSPDSVMLPAYLPDTPETRAELAQYYQSVYRMDQGFKRLFDILKECGKWENSLVIYISDNGIAFPGAKTTLYDPGIHLPCIIKYPGCEFPGSVNNAMVSWADITPTILDFAGLLAEDNHIPGTEASDEYNGYDPPWFRKFHGRSFKKALEAGSGEGYDEVFTSHTFHEITMYYPMRSVQDRQFKLIWNVAWQLPFPHASDLWESPAWQSVINSGTGMFAGRSIQNYNQRPEFELYDMIHDQDELKNLAGEKAFADVLENMKTKLRHYQELTADPWTLKWQHQ